MVEMEGGEEDPFGSLIKLCQITFSQELKLHNCPFALVASDNFPEAVDSLPSQFSSALTTPSEPPGIVMVSLPDPDSEEDKDDDASIERSTPRENEEFQTPQEHQNLSSSSSSQEDLQPPPKSITGIDHKIDGSDDVEMVAIDDGFGKNEVNVKILGFSETVELEGGDRVFGADCWEGGNEVEGIEGVKSQLKRFRAFEGESDEPVLKKIRVSQENWNSETQTVCINETEITEKVDDVDDDEKEEGVDLDAGENSVRMNGGLAVEGYEEGIRENGNDKVCKNGEDVFGCRNIGDTEKFKCIGRSGVDNPGEEKGVGLDGGEKIFLLKRDLVVEASEVGAGSNYIDEIWKNSEEVSSWRNVDEIEQFKYKGGGNGGDQCSKEVARRRRELPNSLREKGNDVGEQGKVDVKNLSWMELLDVVAVVLGKVNDGGEDVDLLEPLKRKSMNFPQPRWI